jgi:3-oxoisoapionate kinase
VSTGRAAPSRLRLAFYGDDFTGATDALEVLTFAGVKAALLLSPPNPATLARLPAIEAIGVAGDSRAMPPGQMDEALLPVLQALSQCGAPIVHYKVCSTFDSGPQVGSIGRVIDLARRHLNKSWIPVVGATPALARYCLFGHLFARSATDGAMHRLDRHPIMRQHPVTPMSESDLRLHLSHQTAAPIACIDFPTLALPLEQNERALETVLADKPGAVLFDGSCEADLTRIGALLQRRADRQPGLFVVGPSGVEYALTQWWRAEGTLSPQSRPPTARTRQTAAHSVLAVSGSASALTALQIDEAIRSGYEEIAVPIGALLATGHESTARQGLCERLKRLLSQGANVIVHTAKGPQDPRIAQAIDLLRSQGLEDTQARLEAGRQLSMRLGELIAQVLRAVRPSRLVLCGGDTSSQVAKVLAPEAIVAVAPLARGAPLCRFIARDSGLDGLLVVFKGGQMGEPAFIVQAGMTEPEPGPEPEANPNPDPDPDPETPEDRDLR